MKKTTILVTGLFSFLLLVGCQSKNKETSNTSKETNHSALNSSSDSETNKTNTSSSSKKQVTAASTTTPTHETSSSRTPEVKIVSEAPIGSWEQAGQHLIIDGNGQWKLEGKINLNGTVKLAAGNDAQWLIKLYGFDARNGNIGSYMLASFNPDKTKMNFGYLGTFTRTASSETSFDKSLFLPKFRTDQIDYKHDLLGTWTMENKAYDFQVQTNYNPDLTFEQFSGGKGAADSGTYTVTPLADNVIRIDKTLNGLTSITYKMEESKLVPADFNWATEIRNKVPDQPQ